MQMATLT